MASNSGVSAYAQLTPFRFRDRDDDPASIDTVVGSEVRQAPNPKSINRLDDILYFRPLAFEPIVGIAQ